MGLLDTQVSHILHELSAIRSLLTELVALLKAQRS